MSRSARVILVLAFTLTLLNLSAPRPVFADAVVGTGDAGSCDEAALDDALAAGGLITFNCGPDPVVFTLTNAKTISVPTTLDGGQLNQVVLYGGLTTRLF